MSASHFLLHRDCFEGTITMSVFVLLSPGDAEQAARCICFLLLGLLLNSSFTMPYPFLAKSRTFASFNFSKARETLGDTVETLDLNFPNNVSAVSLGPDLWCFSSPDELLPFFTSASDLAEVPADSENSCFPFPKVSLT